MSKITQLVKGVYCNARCPMCLSLRNWYASPPKEADICFKKLNLDSFWYALQKTREMGSNELVITSFGDPLDIRNSPDTLQEEIDLAHDLGFEQITLITNGKGLRPVLLNSIIDAGLTHLSLSIHATNQTDYERMLYSDEMLDMALLIGKYAAAQGVVVRHNYVWHEGLALKDVLAQAHEYGAAEVTLIESVPVNSKSVALHTPLPDLSDFPLVKEHAWGMSIYAIDGITVALCTFGQDDPGFAEQEKNLYINILESGEAVLREGAYFDLKDGIL